MTTPETPEPTPQVRMRARRRSGSPLDMVRSLGLVGIAVAGMVAFTFFGQPDRPPVTVDVSATVQAARMQHDFPVLAAASLPTDWYANYASFAPASSGVAAKFHIGYVTDDEQYFAVDVADVSADDSTAMAAPAGDPIRRETVAGLAFDVFTVDGKEAWFHAVDGSRYTVRLSGSGSVAQWQQFIQALSADGPIAS